MATNNEKIGSLIKEFSNPIAVQIIYIKILDGDVTSALFLSQLIYWSDRTKDPERWIYRTYDGWYKEIGLSQYKISRASKVLVSLGFIETKRRRRGTNHQGPVAMHYRISLEKITNSIMKFLDNRETKQSENQETETLSTIDYDIDYKDIAPKNGAGGSSNSTRQESKKKKDTSSKKDALDFQPGSLAFLPSTVRPLGAAFLEEAGAGYAPIQADIGLWRKVTNEWAARGFTPDIIKLAIREMRKAKLTISGPQSITKVGCSIKGGLAKDETKIYHAGDMDRELEELR